jgi:hypothetical protein
MRIHQTVLSLSLLAALIAPIAAQAESDNHVRPPIRYGNTDVDYNTGNPMPTIAQELANRGTMSPIYDPATGRIIYPVPVVAAQLDVPPTQPVVVAPVPVYAPPAYGQPGHGYGKPGYGPVAHRPFVLNQNQVRMSLERQGFHRIQDIDYDRGYYTARARDQRDRSVRLTVSAETGRVLDVR